MIRTVFGSLLALIGAAIAVWSPFRSWYGGRHGSRFRVDDLFTGVGVTADNAALLGPLFLPMGFAALLTLLGVLLRSRPVVALAGLIVLAITILWMVRQGQAAGSLTAGGPGLDTGVAAAFGAAALMLLGAAALPSRRPRPTPLPEPQPQLQTESQPEPRAQPPYDPPPPYDDPPPPYDDPAPTLTDLPPLPASPPDTSISPPAPQTGPSISPPGL
jgi:hypothetical protein